jgi:hypothetical protein
LLVKQESFMPTKQLHFGKRFSVGLTNRRGQAATMVIAAGECEGGHRIAIEAPINGSLSYPGAAWRFLPAARDLSRPAHSS